MRKVNAERRPRIKGRFIKAPISSELKAEEGAGDSM